MENTYVFISLATKSNSIFWLNPCNKIIFWSFPHLLLSTINPQMELMIYSFSWLSSMIIFFLPYLRLQFQWSPLNIYPVNIYISHVFSKWWICYWKVYLDCDQNQTYSLCMADMSSCFGCRFPFCVHFFMHHFFLIVSETVLFALSSFSGLHFID